MTKDALIQVRIAPEVKQNAEVLYDSMGTSLSEAIRMFISQSLIDQRLPFTPTSNISKGSGKGYAMLEIFGRPVRREEERKAWIDSLTRS